MYIIFLIFNFSYEEIYIYRYYCFCGNTLLYNSTLSTLCNAGCGGHANEMCGDKNYLFSVYTMGKLFFKVEINLI